jgi:hypothetical protein
MLLEVEHRDLATLEAGLAADRGAPSDEGTIELIVRRPAVEEREVVVATRLDYRAFR